jgi:hypothetical protein
MTIDRLAPMAEERRSDCRSYRSTLQIEYTFASIANG